MQLELLDSGESPKDAHPSETIVLTRENLHAASSHPCGDGFTAAQMKVLGVEYPPKKGWLSAWVGREVPVSLLQEFKEAGKVYRKRRKRRRNKSTSRTEDRQRSEKAAPG